MRKQFNQFRQFTQSKNGRVPHMSFVFSKKIMSTKLLYKFSVLRHNSLWKNNNVCVSDEKLILSAFSRVSDHE